MLLALVDALQELRNIDHPIVLHVSTAKGKGFEPAQSDPERWHHVGPFDMATGRKLCPGHPSEPRRAPMPTLRARRSSAAIEHDSQVVAITAATPYIMGFTPELRAVAGKQFVDVGIAEEHAVTFCHRACALGRQASLWCVRHVLQRAYDELWHDLCLNDVPATILVFGASIFGTTSETHLSFFDISMLGGLPQHALLGAGLHGGISVHAELVARPPRASRSDPCTGHWPGKPPRSGACRGHRLQRRSLQRGAPGSRRSSARTWRLL